MRKVLFVLAALLIAAPAAMAVPNVDITCTQQEGGWITIGYTVTRGSEEPRLRAVALDVTVDAGAIVDIRGFKTGESTAASKGYGIFPGSIGLADPENPVWGDPIAPADDPGAEGTGLGEQTVILELGSLYEKVLGNEPAEPSGVLCQLRLSNSCTVTVKEEKANRGGIVLEDPDVVPTINVGGAGAVLCSPVWTYTGPDTTEWNYVGQPAAWVAANQCYGDADAALEFVGRGQYPVGMPDIYKLIEGYRQPGFDEVNPPLTPADGPWICADFDHIAEAVGRGLYRVGMPDVVRLIEYYRVPSIEMPDDCQTP